jgi:Tol biopolymer transport system component
MDADGKNQRMFSLSQDLINSHPVWSLDGEVLLFTQMDKEGGAPYIVAASYTDQDYLEFGFNLGPLPVREARYSPDGLWLVFESWPQGSNHDIYIMAASGAGRIHITNFPRWDFDPVWKPAPQD